MLQCKSNITTQINQECNFLELVSIVFSFFPQDYELVPKKGQCCGECVRKRCTFNNQTYEIGDMWKSKDKCRFYECAGNQIAENIVEAKVISYQKSCPQNDNCPSNQIYIKDCCSYCQMEQGPKDQSRLSDFVHAPDKYNAIMSRDTYRQHPCRRECIKDAPPKTCNYTFVVSRFTDPSS